jgi:hypothetical protein
MKLTVLAQTESGYSPPNRYMRLAYRLCGRLANSEPEHLSIVSVEVVRKLAEDYGSATGDHDIPKTLANGEKVRNWLRHSEEWCEHAT